MNQLPTALEDASILNTSSFEKKRQSERIVLPFWKLAHIWLLSTSSCEKKVSLKRHLTAEGFIDCETKVKVLKAMKLGHQLGCTKPKTKNNKNEFKVL